MAIKDGLNVILRNTRPEIKIKTNRKKEHIIRFIIPEQIMPRNYNGTTPISCIEKIRIYITPQKTASMQILNQGPNDQYKWVNTDIRTIFSKPMTADISYDARKLEYDVILNEYISAIQAVPQLKYLGTVAKECHENGLGISVTQAIGITISMMYEPILEKLYKANYKNIALRLMYEYETMDHETVSKALENNFGYTGSNIKDLRISTTELEYCDESYRNEISGDIMFFYEHCATDQLILSLRYLFEDTFIQLDKNTIIEYDKMLSQLNETTSLSVRGFEYAQTGQLNEPAKWDDPKRCIKRLHHLLKKENAFDNKPLMQEHIRLYDDIILLYDNQLFVGNKPEIKLIDYMDSFDTLTYLHDRLVAIMTQQNMALNSKGKKRMTEMEKSLKSLLMGRQRKYEYSDGTFVIKVPSGINDLNHEGTVLKHCVGGYTDQNALGQTTILFLRKASEINKPFYTIEINDNHISQIHGMSNKWLGNNPEAIPFVVDWMKARGLKCYKNVLTNTSLGYSSNNVNTYIQIDSDVLLN